MKCKNLLSWGLLPVCLLLAGCASSWQKPDISLVDVQLAGGALFEQRLKLKLRVYNPNDREIPIEALHFQFLAGDKRFASGQSSHPVLIPGQGEALVEMDASMQLAGLVRYLPELTRGDGKLHYRLRGNAEVKGYGQVPFDHPGEFDLAMFDNLLRKKGALFTQ